MNIKQNLLPAKHADMDITSEQNELFKTIRSLDLKRSAASHIINILIEQNITSLSELSKFHYYDLVHMQGLGINSADVLYKNRLIITP